MSHHLTYLEAVVTGLIQGVTELFPVSSLGHNVLIPALIGGSWASALNVSAPNSPYLAFIVGLHVATAIAMIVYFWRDWLRIVRGFFTSIRTRSVTTPDERLAWMIILATIPVGIVGAALQHEFVKVFAKPELAAVFLAVNGVILLGSERMRRSREAAAGGGGTPTVVLPAGRAFPSGPVPGPPGRTSWGPGRARWTWPTRRAGARGVLAAAVAAAVAGARPPVRAGREPAVPGERAAGTAGIWAAAAAPARAAAARAAPVRAAAARAAPARAAAARAAPDGPGQYGPDPRGGQPGPGWQSTPALGAVMTRATRAPPPGGAGPAAACRAARRRARGTARWPAARGRRRGRPGGGRGLAAVHHGIQAGSHRRCRADSRAAARHQPGRHRHRDRDGARLSRQDAVRFSFLLSAPVILAAGALKAKDLTGPLSAGIHGPIIVGSLISGIGAYLSIRFLTKYFSEDKSLNPFGIYCLIAGLGSLAYLVLK